MNTAVATPSDSNREEFLYTSFKSILNEQYAISGAKERVLPSRENIDWVYFVDYLSLLAEIGWSNGSWREACLDEQYADTPLDEVPPNVITSALRRAPNTFSPSAIIEDRLLDRNPQQTYPFWPNLIADVAQAFAENEGAKPLLSLYRSTNRLGYGALASKLKEHANINFIRASTCAPVLDEFEAPEQPQLPSTEIYLPKERLTTIISDSEWTETCKKVWAAYGRVFEGLLPTGPENVEDPRLLICPVDPYRLIDRTRSPRELLMASRSNSPWLAGYAYLLLAGTEAGRELLREIPKDTRENVSLYYDAATAGVYAGQNFDHLFETLHNPDVSSRTRWFAAKLIENGKIAEGALSDAQREQIRNASEYHGEKAIQVSLLAASTTKDN